MSDQGPVENNLSGSSRDFEPVLERFDGAWQSGTPPRIEDFLPPLAAGSQPGPDQARCHLLDELIKIDLEYRWRRTGIEPPQSPDKIPHVPQPDLPSFPVRPRLEDYVRRFGELGPLDQLALALIAEEYRVRQRWGDHPSHAEYAARFPRHGDELRRTLAGIDAEMAVETVDRPRSLPSSESAVFQSAKIHLSCPHCAYPISVNSSSSPREITCPSCGSNITADSYPTMPDQTRKPPFPRVGRYELYDPLGQGSFGSVWRAWDTELLRWVAVKLPRSKQLDNPDRQEQFLREARSAAQLDHPNIVGIYDVGRDQGTVYIVSELVDGMSLDNWLSGNWLTFQQSAELIAQVAEAVAHAHRRGVIHRDLKPSNIMLDLQGTAGAAGATDELVAAAPGGDASGSSTAVAVSRAPTRTSDPGRAAPPWPRVMDFGLAKWNFGEAAPAPKGKHRVGTMAYMSPEQDHDPHTVDGQADVYSLGVILYQLLTRELPFRGVPDMVRHQLHHKDAEPPRRLNNQIPRDLETITVRCLEKEPKRRTPAAKVASELRRYLANEPLTIRPVGRWERVVKWSRRRPAMAALILISALLVLGVLGGSLAYAALEQKRADVAQQAEKLAKGKADLEQQRADDAQQAAAIQKKLREMSEERERETLRYRYLSDIRLTHYAVKESNITLARELLDGWKEPRKGVDMRSIDWRILRYLSDSSQSTLGKQRGEVTCVAFAPRKDLFAWGTSNITSGGLRIGDKKGTVVFEDKAGAIKSLAFSPDGTLLATGSNDGTLRLWNARDARRPRVLFTYTNVLRVQFDKKEKLLYPAILAVAFSPKGRFLAAGDTQGRVHLWVLTSAANQERTTLEGLASYHAHRGNVKRDVRALAFAPDGRILASASSDRTVMLWDVGALESALPIVGASTAGLMSSPLSHGPLLGASTLLSGTTNRSTKFVSQAKSLVTFEGHNDIVWSVAFAPDSKTVASGGQDGTIKIWDAGTGRERLTLSGHRGPVYSLAFSPRKAIVASASGDKTLRLWDSATGRELATRRGHTDAVLAASFSMDGTTLVTGSKDKSLKLWDVTLKQPLYGHTMAVRSVAFSPDHKLLATASGDGTIKLWDTASRELVRSLKTVHEKGVLSVAFDPDGARLISAGMDGKILDWSVTDENEGPRILQDNDKKDKWEVRSVAISRNGKFLVSGSADNTVRLWQFDGKVLFPLRELKESSQGAKSVAISTDGQRVAAGFVDGTVIVWDAQGKNTVRFKKRHEATVMSVAFAPDGRSLASAGVDKKVFLWDLQKGADQKPSLLKGHTDVVTAVAFTPDGKVLVSGSLDRTVKLWDTELKQERITLEETVAPVWCIAVADDGTMLAAGSAAKTVQLWEAP